MFFIGHGSLGKNFDPGFVPGYNFPIANNVPEDGDVHEGFWIHFTWCFADKSYVQEVPLDPEINFHAEEPYVTIQSWCRGWRFFATSKLLSWHQMEKKYPDEKHTRIATHRPWADKNKNDFWNQSDQSLLKLNKLLSGKLKGKYGNISKEDVLLFCCESGMQTKWTEYNENYHKLPYLRHGQTLKDKEIIKYEKINN